MTRFHGYALFALTFHAFFAAECRTPRRETHVSAVRPPPACSHQAVLTTHTKISRPGTSPHVSYHPGQWRRTDNG